MTIRCLSESVQIGDPFFLAIQCWSDQEKPFFVPSIVLGWNLKLEAIVRTSQGQLVNTEVKPVLKIRAGESYSGLSTAIEPGRSRTEVLLIDPWSPELVEFVTANKATSIGIRTTLTHGMVSSYDPYRLDLPISGSILGADELLKIEDATKLFARIPVDLAEKLASEAPGSNLSRNLRVSQQSGQLLDSRNPDDVVAQRLSDLLDSVPAELRSWYEASVLKLAWTKRPGVYRVLNSMSEK